MHLNYLFLTRLSVELKNILPGKSVLGFHTQEKNKLVMTLGTENDQMFIEFSTDPSFLYINQRKSYTKAHKNFKDFLPDQVPSQISDIQIASGDRVIRFVTGNFDLYFLVRGRFSNIFFTENDRILATFKEMKEERAIKIFSDIKGYTFLSPTEITVNPLKETYNSPEEIKAEFPFISKEILSLSPDIDPATPLVKKSQLIKIRDDFKDSLFSIIESEDKQFRIVPDNWALSSRIHYAGLTALEAVNNLIRLFYQNEGQIDIKEKILAYLNKELGKTERSIAALEEKISAGSKSKFYRNCGNLLLANFYLLKKGQDSIRLTDEKGDTVNIKLIPSLSPQKNIDHYFESARDEEISISKNEELLNNYLVKREKIKELINTAENTLMREELEQIAKKLNIKMEKKSNSNPASDVKFREFLIDEKYRLYVGKDSVNNDLLTLHFAKKEDLWFHARSVPGSHVVLRVEGDYKEIPKSVIKTAASVAAYYSKAKTAGLSPVAFTQKKYVIKRKGYEPGKVALLKESVIIVRPEIPDNCKPINENLI